MSYNETLTAARQRPASVPRHTVEVPALETVEYTDVGSGPPALVTHALLGAATSVLVWGGST